ncbi:MAG TPA: six-hairpin glycosidase [Firmicutes bacterium]|nr:six-hairpin glycosidase [Bacillota bacterium]
MNYRQQIAAADPIRYIGSEKADIRFYDGALKHAVGAKHYQVVRANREFPETQEDYGWTYNHAPMLCWWNGHFWIEYLSNPVSEHEPPSHTLLTWSRDGEEWVKPVVIFPQFVLPEGVYQGPKQELLRPGDTAIMHQRMGFYITKDDRLFVLGFYGVSPEVHTSPNNGYGIARVVREVYHDFTFSPVYVLRYNRFSGFEPEHVPFLFYQESDDPGFITACEELLSNKLVIWQWWEEQRFDTELFPQPSRQALCYYTLPDRRVVGFYKHALVNFSEDGGQTWSDFVKCYSIETSTGKIWGERTSDGRYALIYNPSTDSMHRWPLAVATSDDGINFDNLLALTIHVPPMRYVGWAKNLGPQYVRGICEGYPKPDDGHLWITYSMNKEDIWVAKVPVPITGAESEPIDEDFSDTELPRWNIYAPRWCRIYACPANKWLVITDSDPYDQAIAERVFMESTAVTVKTRIIADSFGLTGLYIDLTDDSGSVPVRLVFKHDQHLYIKSNGVYNDVGKFALNKAYDLAIQADCVLNQFSVAVECDGELLVNKAYKFNTSVHSLERLVFHTKQRVNYYDLEANGKDGSMPDLPGAGSRNQETKFYIVMVKTDEHCL